MKTLATLALLSFAVTSSIEAADMNQQTAPSYFIDVCDYGPGKITLEGVARAHRLDVAVQKKHNVRLLDAWFDEEHGRVYSLLEANNAASIVDVHREGDGRTPSRILPVSAGTASPARMDGPLFLDIHELGPGSVTAPAVAEAHQKDLQVEGGFGVNFINYWVDEADGTVLCLSNAADGDSIRETHRRAHGLVPAYIVKVMEAR